MNQKIPDEPLGEAQETEPVFLSHERSSVRRGPMTPKQRQLLIALSLLAALAIAIVFILLWRWRNATPAEEKTNVVVSVKVGRAQKEPIAAQISAIGTIWPRDKAD